MEEITIHIIDECSDGEFHYFIGSICTMHELDTSSLTIFCRYFFDVAEIGKCILVWISDDDEITSSTTITSEWSTFGNSRFSPPGNNTISSISCPEFHINSIDEHFDNL